MLLVEGIRKKLFTQRRSLFRHVAQTEDELLWLETDVEREVEERGQEEGMIGCLIVWMGERRPRLRRSIGLVKLETAQYGRCERCGEAIPPSRLESLPAAALCLVCAQAGEKLAALRK